MRLNRRVLKEIGEVKEIHETKSVFGRAHGVEGRGRI